MENTDGTVFVEVLLQKLKNKDHITQRLHKTFEDIKRHIFKIK